MFKTNVNFFTDSWNYVNWFTVRSSLFVWTDVNIFIKAIRKLEALGMPRYKERLWKLCVVYTGTNYTFTAFFHLHFIAEVFEAK